jgi:Golgi phosphoprotein 3 (GPP34)
MHEQNASRPGGYQPRTPPPRGLGGTGLVADDLYLLGHEERSGKPLLQVSSLGTGLAGALLAELMLAGWISLRHDGAVIITRDAPPAAVRQHALLKRIADKPGPETVRSWVRVLAHSTEQEIAVRLEAAGYLDHVRGRVPWRQGRWVPVDPDWAYAAVLRARAALDPTRPLTAHAATLAGLTAAAGLGFRLSEHQTQEGRSVEDAVVQLSPGLQHLIAQTASAVENAVLSYRTW